MSQDFSFDLWPESRKMYDIGGVQAGLCWQLDGIQNLAGEWSLYFNGSNKADESRLHVVIWSAMGREYAY